MAKPSGSLSIQMPVKEWEAISDGIDKLLDFEAKQPSKVITDKEFRLLERLLKYIAEE